MRHTFLIGGAYFCSLFLSAGLAKAETEVDRAVAHVRTKFPHPAEGALRQEFEKVLSEINPRIYELMRRIDRSYESIGDVNAEPASATQAQFLCSQIDSLLFNPPAKEPDGIVAVRVVSFSQGDAKRLVYWRRPNSSGEVAKTVWQRRFPERMLDFSSPLGGWTKVFEANKVALKECEMILPFFGDPMPPTTLPAAAWQLRARQDFIVEMITKSDGVMKYHRAIRSSHYTRDLDFEAFSKVWSVLGELSESDSANKKARVATADNLASSLRSGCSTPPCQSSNVR